MAVTIRRATIGVQHFNAARFDAFLASHGMTARFERGIACPCVSTETGAPDPSCAVCEGLGAHYYETAATEIKVYATRKLMREVERYGTWMPGVSDYTFPSTVLAKPFDRFEIQSDRIAVDQVLVKGAVNPRTNASREVLRFPTVLAIEHAECVFRHPTSGVPYVSTAFDLVENTHFTRSGRQITWTQAGDAIVADGQVYTVRYLALPMWLVWAQRQRSEADQRMPGTYECRRLDHVARQQGDGVES